MHRYSVQLGLLLNFLLMITLSSQPQIIREIQTYTVEFPYCYHPWDWNWKQCLCTNKNFIHENSHKNSLFYWKRMWYLFNYMICIWCLQPVSEMETFSELPILNQACPVTPMQLYEYMCTTGCGDVYKWYHVVSLTLNCLLDLRLIKH